MKNMEDLNYYELLEVSPRASTQEIYRAYERLRRIYDPNSIALYSLFTPEETAAISRRIEDAYHTLLYEDKRRRYDETLQDKDVEQQPAAPGPYPVSLPIQPALPLVEETPPPPDPVTSPPPSQDEPATVASCAGEYTGPAIRALREERKHTLRSIADLTKVGIRYLEFIEEENFAKLPARTYIRGFLMLYANALGCDVERMTGDYLKRFDAAMKPLKKKL